jgi:hypothetical protein
VLGSRCLHLDKATMNDDITYLKYSSGQITVLRWPSYGTRGRHQRSDRLAQL